MTGTDQVMEREKTGGKASGQRGRPASAPVRQRAGLISRTVLLCLAIAGLAAVASVALLRQPMDVPDAATLTTSNYQGNVDAGNWVGQSFLAKRDGLSEISLVLATELPNDYSSIDFTLREGGPDGVVLRGVKLPIAGLPTGSPYDIRPGSLDERWTTVRFEPLQGSAGRTYYFEVSGKYVPNDNKVQTLMMFQGKYTQGKGYVNGEARDNANVVFRAKSQGTVGDYVGVLAENLTANKPGPLASPATYIALGVAYFLLLAALLVSVQRALRAPS